VVGADGDADEGHDEASLLAVTGECGDDEDGDSCWRWWQSEAGKPEKRLEGGTAVGGASSKQGGVGSRTGGSGPVNERDEGERTAASCASVWRRCGRSRGARWRGHSAAGGLEQTCHHATQA
jgi:hypothetical protein